MLELVVKMYDEKDNREFYYRRECEGDLICWGRFKSKYDIRKSYSMNCGIGVQKVNSTISAKQQLEYWKEHYDEYCKNHLDPELRDDLNYFIMEVTLYENEEIIKQEKFRYGL